MTESHPAVKTKPSAELASAERRALKARAHDLEPVVLIGDKGLTPAVLAEIERALAAHELVKIRAQAGREDRAGLLAEICGRTGASSVQRIGKMLVVYRRKSPEAPPAEDRDKVRKAAARKAELRAKAGEKPARKPGLKPGSRTRVKFGARAARGTERPGSRTASPRRAPERPLRRPRTSR